MGDNYGGNNQDTRPLYMPPPPGSVQPSKATPPPQQRFASNNGVARETNATSNTPFTVPPKRLFIIDEEVLGILDAAVRMSDNGQRVNVLVRGPQGCGKSDMIAQLANRAQRPLAVLDIGRLSSADQLLGYMDIEAETRRPVFRPGLFIQAIQTPGCVVHLQELNRPETDKALNAVFSLLDDTNRRIWIDELQQYIEVAPGVIVAASFNEGFEFIGTMPLDAALEDRFHIKVYLNYLPAESEINLLCSRTKLNRDVAARIVEVAGQMRNNAKEPVNVSTRSLIVVADLMNNGVGLVAALRACLGSNGDALESVLLGLHMSGENIGATERQFAVM